MSRHPATRTLRAWAEGRKESVTAHIETCETCQEHLDDLTDLSPRVRQALDGVTSPSSGFLQRLDAALAARRRDLETWDAVADLFSLPWRVFGAVVDDDDN